MYATKILWGQITVVLTIILATTWAATQWVAWRLGYQPQLGQPWFELAGGVPVYLPPAFFWWWYAYDAYAPSIFIEGATIVVSGGFLSIAVAIGCRSGAPVKQRMPRPMVRPAGPAERKWRGRASLALTVSCLEG